MEDIAHWIRIDLDHSRRMIPYSVGSDGYLQSCRITYTSRFIGESQDNFNRFLFRYLYAQIL